VTEPAVALLLRRRACRFGCRHVFTLASVVTDSIAQRANRYAQQVRGAGPVSPLGSQRLQNELTLDKRKPVTDQLFDAGAVDSRKSAWWRGVCGVDKRTLRRLVARIVWHHHLHERDNFRSDAPREQGESAWLTNDYLAIVFHMELFEITELFGTSWNFGREPCGTSPRDRSLMPVHRQRRSACPHRFCIAATSASPCRPR
jgi:hypothetical protein